jgi:hypothetical protein
MLVVMLWVGKWMRMGGGYWGCSVGGEFGCCVLNLVRRASEVCVHIPPSKCCRNKPSWCVTLLDQPEPVEVNQKVAARASQLSRQDDITFFSASSTTPPLPYRPTDRLLRLLHNAEELHDGSRAELEDRQSLWRNSTFQTKISQ